MATQEKSAVEEILKGLEEEGERQKKAILNSAKKEAKRILDEGKKKAEEEYERIFSQKTARLNAEINKIIRNAEIEREKILAGIRAKFLNEVFSTVLKTIDEVRNTDRYQKALKKMFEEAVYELGESGSQTITPEILAEAIQEAGKEQGITFENALQIARNLLKEGIDLQSSNLWLILSGFLKKRASILVKCNPEDVSIIQKIAKEKGIDAIIQENKNITGGVVVYSGDRKIVVDASIEARLNKIKRLFSKELVEIFLEKQEQK